MSTKTVNKTSEEQLPSEYVHDTKKDTQGVSMYVVVHVVVIIDYDLQLISSLIPRPYELGSGDTQ